MEPSDPLAAVASDTTLMSSPLAESLTEFAGVLGSPPGAAKEGVEFGTGEWEVPDGKDMEEGMYNPFDSHGELVRVRGWRDGNDMLVIICLLLYLQTVQILNRKGWSFSSRIQVRSACAQFYVCLND